MANPIGSESLTACVPVSLSQEIAKLAKQSGLSKSGYVKALLEDAVKRRRIFKVRVEEYSGEVAS